MLKHLECRRLAEGVFLLPMQHHSDLPLRHDHYYHLDNCHYHLDHHHDACHHKMTKDLVVHDLPGRYFLLQTKSRQRLADDLRDCWHNCNKKIHDGDDDGNCDYDDEWWWWWWPWLTISSPAGPHASPGLKRMKIVFSGRVWKYSPSSTLDENINIFDSNINIINIKIEYSKTWRKISTRNENTNVMNVNIQYQEHQ